MTYKQIISELKKLGDKDKIVLKEKKFGITANNSLGIYHNDLKELAKQIDKDNQLAIQLFDSGIYEARILCSKLYNISDLTENLMEKWVATFENWEICDTFCMGLFAKSKFAISKAIQWTDRENEFEKRINKIEELKADNLAALAKQNNLFSSLQHAAFSGQL